MWQLTPLPSSEPGVARAKLACRKMSEAETFPPFIVRLDFNGENIIAIYDGRVSEPGVIAPGPTDVEVIAQILRGVSDGMTRSAIQSRTGIPRDRVRDALKDPRFRATGRGKATRYFLCESNEPPGDSAGDSGNDSGQSNGSPATLMDALDPGDSGGCFTGVESNGGPADPNGATKACRFEHASSVTEANSNESLSADRLTLFEDTLL